MSLERKGAVQVAPPSPTVTPALAEWFIWMDFFRTGAAVIVVLSHARDLVVVDYNGPLLYAPFYAATGFGHSGVVIFFVLSGFWISRSVLNRLDSPHFWRDYLIDRLSRLLIVLIPALALGGLLDWIGAIQLELPLYAGTSGAHSLGGSVIGHLRPEVLFGNLTFLQTVFVPTWGSNGPLWSLAFEFWFYIWFPALAFLLLRKRISVSLIGLVIAWINPSIAFGFLTWLAGFVLLKLSQRPPIAAMRAWQVAGIVLVFLAILLISARASDSAMDVVLAVAFAALLYALRANAVRFPRWLAMFARFGRDSSYSLYVVHFPILALTGSLLSGGERLAPSPLSIGLVAVLTLGCVTIAWLFSELTEQNTDKVREFLHRRLG
jgi:peptidoglycan/LPS O-acetylase OafA/YrhL